MQELWSAFGSESFLSSGKLSTHLYLIGAHGSLFSFLPVTSCSFDNASASIKASKRGGRDSTGPYRKKSGLPIEGLLDASQRKSFITSEEERLSVVWLPAKAWELCVCESPPWIVMLHDPECNAVCDPLWGICGPFASGKYIIYAKTQTEAVHAVCVTHSDYSGAAGKHLHSQAMKSPNTCSSSPSVWINETETFPPFKQPDFMRLFTVIWLFQAIIFQHLSDKHREMQDISVSPAFCYRN